MMRKFTFGRKKTSTPPPAPLLEPLSKAQRILGAAAPATETKFTAKIWDQGQRSNIRINAIDTVDAADDQNSRESESRHGHRRGASTGSMGSRWRHKPLTSLQDTHVVFLGEEASDDLYDADLGRLESQYPLHHDMSWHDSSKTPLATIHPVPMRSQGLPSKAQRLLDIDNTASNRQDFQPQKRHEVFGHSNMKRSNSGTTQQLNGSMDMFQVGNGVRSQPFPANGGALTESHKQPRKKLQKRHTREDLLFPDPDATFQSENDPFVKINTVKTLDAVPDLYQHYEQMSFRQVMSRASKTEELIKETQLDILELPGSPVRIQAMIAELSADGALQDPPFVHKPSHERQLSQPSFTRNSMLSLKEEGPSSISSRHTRTSLASRTTSMHQHDVLDKTMLILSSDSEEDEDGETEDVAAAEPPNLTSPVESHSNLALRTIPERSSSTASQRQRNHENRASSNYSRNGKPSGAVPRHTYSLMPRIRSPMSPSGTFTFPNASLGSPGLPGWQTNSGFGVQKTGNGIVRSAPILPTEATPAPIDVPDSKPHRASLKKLQDEASLSDYETGNPPSSQPTPPLSPATAQRSDPSGSQPAESLAPASQDRLAESRFMSVTLEEEMLLDALRQKRRQAALDEPLEDTLKHLQLESQLHRRASLTHKSTEPLQAHRHYDSDSTISGWGFDFGFPSPPSAGMNLGRRASSRLENTVPWTKGSFPAVDKHGIPILSPPPLHRLKHDSFALPEPALEIEEELSDDSQGLDIDQQGILRRTNPKNPRDSMADGVHKALRKKSRSRGSDAGIPRPDSPVDVFPPLPSFQPKIDTKMARLSAVGPRVST